MKYVCLLFILLDISGVNAQEKSKYIHRFETVNFNVNSELKVESLIEEKKYIPKSKFIKDYSEKIYHNNFEDIVDIKGFTYNKKDKKKTYLSNTYISDEKAEQQNIFHSDYRVRSFVFPNVEDDAEVEFSYKTKYKYPQFLSFFRFQDELQMEKSRIKLICDQNIEIGYKLFGNHQDKIKFSETEENGKKIYTWEAENLPDFEFESGMPHYSYFIPHLIYYVKSYTNKKGEKKELLGTTKKLHAWYKELNKDINKTDQNELKNKTLELIKDKITDYEKTKVIYNWVQENLQYVAFEYGFGGFVARNASDIFTKKYGDCKDMANLMNEMLKYAGINSNFTWIGTRHKPYTYEECPTPQVDNHAITSVLIDGKRYFLDATDKFCVFPFPTDMIQGKEALISLSETDFIVEKVPIIEAEQNKIKVNLTLNVEQNSVVGNITSDYFGYNKSNLANALANYSTKEKEIWKDFIVDANEKIILDNLQTFRNDYNEKPAQAISNLKLENWIKETSGIHLLKPILLFPLKESTIDTEKRKLPIQKDYTYFYDINYTYSIPEHLKIDFIPKDAKFSNDLIDFEINYKTVSNQILVNQKIKSKTLLINPNDFEKWNQSIQELNKNYNQSIILK